MSVFLVGGPGLPETESAIHAAFLAEAATLGVVEGRRAPRIAVLVVHDGDGLETASSISRSLERGSEIEAVPVLVREGGAVEPAALADVDGLIVAGGLVSAYAIAGASVAGEIRRRVAAGMPYLGVSAGAMIAAESAIVGGWRVGDVPVIPEAAGEELDELTIEDGLGLVDLAIDTHAAQWGTVGRLIAATEAGVVDGGVAIDENTALVVAQGRLRVIGGGSVWQVFASEHGVVVRTMGAE